MTRELEPWGGEVRLPRWLRKLLRRPEAPEDTPEAAHERRKTGAISDVSVFENADRASVGALTQLYREGRGHRR
jgi:hypothetical protein